jgi:hypothetical protein
MGVQQTFGEKMDRKFKLDRKKVDSASEDLGRPCAISGGERSIVEGDD